MIARKTLFYDYVSIDYSWADQEFNLGENDPCQEYALLLLENNSCLMKRYYNSRGQSFFANIRSYYAPEAAMIYVLDGEFSILGRVSYVEIV